MDNSLPSLLAITAIVFVLVKRPENAKGKNREDDESAHIKILSTSHLYEKLSVEVFSRI
jgi:hypothetical protein